MECSNLCMTKICTITPFFTFILHLYFLLHMFIIFPSAFIPFMIPFFFFLLYYLLVAFDSLSWSPVNGFPPLLPSCSEIAPSPWLCSLWLHTLDLLSAVVTSPTPPPVWATTKCRWQSSGNIRSRDFQVCLLLCLHVEKLENKNGAYHVTIYSVSCSVLSNMCLKHSTIRIQTVAMHWN